ncbi:MAG: tetratricopeptide repeat protein, partial [Candidatus Helarchaeota archaeon]
DKRRVKAYPYLIREILANYYFLFGDYLYKQKKTEEALINYEKACEFGYDMIPLFYNYALVLIKMNKLDMALDKLIKAYKIDKNNPYVLNKIGELYYKKGEFNKAYDYFIRALDLWPNFERAKRNLNQIKQIINNSKK